MVRLTYLAPGEPCPEAEPGDFLGVWEVEPSELPMKFSGLEVVCYSGLFFGGEVSNVVRCAVAYYSGRPRARARPVGFIIDTFILRRGVLSIVGSPLVAILSIFRMRTHAKVRFCVVETVAVYVVNSLPGGYTQYEPVHKPGCVATATVSVRIAGSTFGLAMVVPETAENEQVIFVINVGDMVARNGYDFDHAADLPVRRAAGCYQHRGRLCLYIKRLYQNKGLKWQKLSS